MDETPAAQTPPTAHDARPAWSARLESYLAVLRPLKAKSALREVLERELLLCFIEVNSGGISEYPMLATQQQSIVNLLCRRSDHPADSVLRKLAGNFPVLLNRLDKETAAADQAAMEQTTALLRNTESLLVKSVQGMVFAMGLTTDNFEELIMRHFGAPGLSQFAEILKNNEFDQGFWREFVERFIAQHVAEGYEHLTRAGKFHLSKDGQTVVVRYLFDDVLATLHDSPGEIEQTRVQTGFAKASAPTPERLAVRKVVQACLLKGLGFLPGEMLLEHLESAALIVCMDPVAESLHRSMQARAAGQEAQEKHPLPFLMEQAVALALGAVLVLSKSREDFLTALGSLRSDELDAVRALAQGLSIESLERVLFFLLESAFVGLLRDKARDEGAKVTIKTAALRRSPVPAVDALASRGLTRIRKSQIWLADPTRPDMLLFKTRTPQQLVSIMQVLQLEEPLQAEVRRLWEGAPFRRDFLVVIDLAQVARTTQNVKAKLSELLLKFGAIQAPPLPVPGAAESPQA
ncbi:MAG TPA: hypothetical protein VN419_04450 [Humidesulfovibrio sp.]|uniref:hypothetical protein n=1 Tax=Humidesulfovibrio sp. TaxID=2910988 RepID=UPI002BD63B71|nr:hypothetical protein [Humidesulfovibrio sp.]HWR03252.1 hypothetical protein [Humidesulfovibrio sp.]